MAIAAVSISPVGVGTSVSKYVAAALEVVRAQSRVRYRLDPMFTTLEGELGDIYALVQRDAGGGVRGGRRARRAPCSRSTIAATAWCAWRTRSAAVEELLGE